MRLAIVLVASALGGCVTADKFTTADGRTAYVISCDGSVQSIGACYAKAEEMCGGGFEVANRSERSSPIGTISPYGGSLSTVETRNIEVVCKSPVG